VRRKTRWLLMESTARTSSVKAAQGGSFLIEDRDPQDVFTPEDFSEEQQQIAKTAAEFARNEVMPATREIEAKNFAVTKGLLRKAGELGLMAVDVPANYGGMEMDKVSSAVVADSISKLASFSVAFGAHVGIGTLPIVWYAPKRKNRNTSRNWRAVNGSQLTRSLSDFWFRRSQLPHSRGAVEDGSHYVLNGEKMWITNAGFADLFVVSSRKRKEKNSPLSHRAQYAGLLGWRGGAQTGNRGSSTCPLILADCRVPVEKPAG